VTSSNRRRAAKRPAPAPARSRRSARAAAQARRSRVLVAAASIFAVGVLATSFPFSSLFGQHRQLSAAQGQVTRLTDENRALSSEIVRLGDPGTVAAIARADYGFVQPGQTAYDILPTAGAPLTSAANSGHVPLEGSPVAPGSARSQALLDAGAGAPASSVAGAGTGVHAATGAATGTAHHQGGSTTQATSPSFWGRVLRTLQFWR
jgi:cell division protein FtsB